MSWAEITVRHGYGAFLLFLAMLTARGRFVAPAVRDDDPNGTLNRVLHLSGQTVAALLCLAATTAFALQEGWVLGIQLAAIYGLFVYVVLAGGVRLAQVLRSAKSTREG